MPLSQHLKLTVCECGHLHLTHRSVTLHFNKEEFLDYAAHVSRMATQISDLVSPRPTIAPGTGKSTNVH